MSAKCLASALGVNCLLMALWVFPYQRAQYSLALFTRKTSITTTADDSFFLFFFVETKNSGISFDICWTDNLRKMLS